jgi:hypothetical protein
VSPTNVLSLGDLVPVHWEGSYWAQAEVVGFQDDMVVVSLAVHNEHPHSHNGYEHVAVPWSAIGRHE